MTLCLVAATLGLLGEGCGSGGELTGFSGVIGPCFRTGECRILILPRVAEWKLRFGSKGAAGRASEKWAENKAAADFRLHGGAMAGPILGRGVARNMNRDQTV